MMDERDLQSGNIWRHRNHPETEYVVMGRCTNKDPDGAADGVVIYRPLRPKVQDECYCRSVENFRERFEYVGPLPIDPQLVAIFGGDWPGDWPDLVVADDNTRLRAALGQIVALEVGEGDTSALYDSTPTLIVCDSCLEAQRIAQEALARITALSKERS